MFLFTLLLGLNLRFEDNNDFRSFFVKCKKFRNLLHGSHLNGWLYRFLKSYFKIYTKGRRSKKINWCCIFTQHFWSCHLRAILSRHRQKMMEFLKYINGYLIANILFFSVNKPHKEHQFCGQSIRKLRHWIWHIQVFQENL